MKLDPAIVLVVKRIAQEFKKLRQRVKSDVDALAVRVGDLATTAGTPGPKGDKGDKGDPGAAGSSGSGTSYLAYDIALTDAPATITDPFSATFILPAAPVIAGKTFTGVRIIRDSRLAVNILATATGSFTSAAIIEYPILNVFQVQSSAAGFVPFYCHRRMPVAGAYVSGSPTGLLSEEFSSEVKLRVDDFNPDGVESITLADLGHYIPEYVEDNVQLTWDAGSARVWERVRFEYEYTETIAALSVSEATSDETVGSSSFPVLAVFGNTDGAFTITVTGGTGPYSLEIDGVGVVATGSSPLTATGLAGGDYDYKVRDSFGQVHPSSGWQTIHVYREAFSIPFTQSATLAIQFTPWTNTVNIYKYDEGTYLGTLASVELIQTACAARSYGRVENLGGTGGTAVTTIDVTLGVEYPAATLIATDTVTITPQFSNVLTAYDGFADYGGTSGVSNARRSTSKTTVHAAAITPTSDFVGSGTQAITMTASDTASVSGVSPYLLDVAPELGPTITVRYTVTGARV